MRAPSITVVKATANDVIAAVRRSHDRLASFVERAEGTTLRAPSGCSEWNVAQVLSHLGSAAEIGHHTLATGKADFESAPAIWDRWNAMGPEDQATNFVAASGRLVAALEDLDDDARVHRKVDVGFLPAPIDIAFFAAMRLREAVLHGWDIDVASDAAATLADDAVPLLLENVPLFSGFFAKPAGRTGLVDVTTSGPDGRYTIELADGGAGLTEGGTDDAGTHLHLPAEAFIRLTSGRLASSNTPGAVSIEGDVTLDDLRRVWPGY